MSHKTSTPRPLLAHGPQVAHPCPNGQQIKKKNMKTQCSNSPIGF